MREWQELMLEILPEGKQRKKERSDYMHSQMTGELKSSEVQFRYPFQHLTAHLKLCQTRGNILLKTIDNLARSVGLTIRHLACSCISPHSISRTKKSSTLCTVVEIFFTILLLLLPLGLLKREWNFNT